MILGGKGGPSQCVLTAAVAGRVVVGVAGGGRAFVDGSFGLLLVAAGIAGVHGWRFSGGDGDVQFLGFALAAMDSFVSKIGWCERDIRGGVLNGPFPVDFGKDVDAVAGVGGGDKDHVSI